MCGDVKEMRESVYGRQRGDFEEVEKPARGMRRGDSRTRGIKTVERKGVGKAEGVTKTRLESKSSSAAAAKAPTQHVTWQLLLPPV